MTTTTEAKNHDEDFSCTSATTTATLSASTSPECSEQNSVDGNQETQPAKERTQAEKKMDRILANRQSARRSRERKKQLQQNLEVTVALLSKNNEDLTQENNALKQKVQILSDVVSELTKQGQEPLASDNLTLALLMQQMQSTAAANDGQHNPIQQNTSSHFPSMSFSGRMI